MEVDEAGGRGADGGDISDIEVIEQPKLGVASSSSFPKESRWNSGSRDEADKSPTKKHVAMAMKRMVDLDIADLEESEGVHSSGSTKKQGMRHIAALILQAWFSHRSACFYHPCVQFL